MKICMVGVEIGPSKEGGFIGGSVNNVVSLSKGLHEKGHQIFLITTPARFSGNQIPAVPWAEVRRIRIRGTYPSVRYGSEFVLKALGEIKKLKKREKIDLIHSHSGFPAIGLISTVSKKLYGIRSIHSLYCPIPDYLNRNIGSFITQSAFVIKNCFLNVDRILALSKNVSSSLKSIGITKKIEVIPPIIDMNSFNSRVSGEEIRQNLKLNSDDRLLVFVGNFTKTKGIHVLIRAMKQVVVEFPEVRLLVILHIPNYSLEIETKSFKKKIDSLGLTKNVLFMGITDKMPNVLAACDLMVAPFQSTIGPSDYPIPILEAMATGKPVVATNVGGISEIIVNNNSGLLIEPNHPEQLAKAISHLLENDSLRMKFGQTASRFALKNFSANMIVKKTERVYEEVVEM